MPFDETPLSNSDGSQRVSIFCAAGVLVSALVHRDCFFFEPCRADTADVDAVCGGLGAPLRVAVACMPWTGDEPRARGVSV